jgi:spore coat polysaccharide biosynthesis predicted glycosyltransferase SpsG
MQIIFRAEFGASFGMGHIARCLKLAQSFNLETKPILLTRNSNGLSSALEIMAPDFWDVRILAANVSIEQDVKITSKYFQSSEARFIVTDLCHAENIKNPRNLRDYHKLLYKNNVTKIIAISDFRISDLCVDLSIIPYECPKERLKDLELMPNLLYGLDYFISSPELPKLKTKSPVAQIGSKIFVCIGGSDPYGVTPKVLSALREIKTPCLTVRVVNSSAMDSSTYSKIKQICEKHKNFHSISFSNNFLNHAAWADIAITGEGLIKYETTSIGVPTLVITQSDHDSDIIKNFLGSGVTAYLGRADQLKKDRLKKSILKIIYDQNLRKKLKESGLNLVDGQGVKRINQHINQIL